MRTHAEIEKTERTKTAYVSAMFYCLQEAAAHIRVRLHPLHPLSHYIRSQVNWKSIESLHALESFREHVAVSLYVS